MLYQHSGPNKEANDSCSERSLNLTKPIPLAEASLTHFPSLQILVYSQETAHSFPHFKEKTQNTVKDDCRTS